MLAVGSTLSEHVSITSSSYVGLLLSDAINGSIGFGLVLNTLYPIISLAPPVVTVKEHYQTLMQVNKTKDFLANLSSHI